MPFHQRGILASSIIKTDYRHGPTQDIFHQAPLSVIMTLLQNNNPPMQTLALISRVLFLHIVVQLYCTLISFKGHWQNKTNVRNIWEEATPPIWGILNAINFIVGRQIAECNSSPCHTSRAMQHIACSSYIKSNHAIWRNLPQHFPAFIFHCSFRGLIWILLTQ